MAADGKLDRITRRVNWSADAVIVVAYVTSRAEPAAR